MKMLKHTEEHDFVARKFRKWALPDETEKKKVESQLPTFRLEWKIVDSCPPTRMRTSWHGFLLCALALVMLCTRFRPCQALEQQEIDALKNIYHANPSLMNTFGWSSNSESACDLDSSWNQTIACKDNHIAEM